MPLKGQSAQHAPAIGQLLLNLDGGHADNRGKPAGDILLGRVEDLLKQQLAIRIDQGDRADEAAVEHGIDDGLGQHIVVIEQGSLQHQPESGDGGFQVG